MKKEIKKFDVLLNKIGMVIIIIIALFSIVFYWYYSQVKKIDYYKSFPLSFSVKTNPINGEYVIGGEVFNIVNGEAKGNNSSSIVIVDSIDADINGDFKKDNVFLVAYSNGNVLSYYVAAAITINDHYFPSNAIFVDDDIIQTELSFDGESITERYYENKSDYKNKKNEKIVYLKCLDKELKQIIK
ncbi:hypothetical protein M0R01_01130 [bacterium]|nr:hypothetical protein [bacterium]